MTSHAPGDDSVVGGNGGADPDTAPSRWPRDGEREPAPDREGNPVVSWAKAIAGGITDTAKQMLDEGRRGAQEAYDDGWRRFDDKTRYRREGGRKRG